MNSKNTNDTNNNLKTEKNIKWENLDALLSVAAVEDIEDCTPVKDEKDGKEQEKGPKPKIILPAITLLVIILFIGAMLLAESEPSLHLAEYRQVNIEESDNFGSQVWALVLNESAVDSYPTKEIELLSGEIQARLNIQAQQYGMTLEQYTTGMGMDEEGYQVYLLETAEHEYLSRRVAISIAVAEGIEPSEEEYEKLINSTCAQLGYLDIEAALKAGYSADQLKYRVLTEKVAAWLGENTISSMDEIESVEGE